LVNISATGEKKMAISKKTYVQIAALETIARKEDFTNGDWIQLTAIADDWIKAKDKGGLKTPIYSPLKKVLVTHCSDIKALIADNISSNQPYREFALFHSREWETHLTLADNSNFVYKKEFATNIRNWNKRIEKNVAELEKTVGTNVNLELFAEYADLWTRVKNANCQPSATYSMTMMIRKHSLDDLIRYLKNYAIVASNHQAETLRYRRIYRYVHFHIRDWAQFQALNSLPVI
jgi:hypothetical protein